ncbi:ROK family protein [Orrella daihaiensis]|uniref:ROK family protein n=2 Tax=Orrella daihaiensis TaxID=2782176 RepID=A0ABY4APH1_9BURK|nr:ROK family protein [Orrella daihaiensis]
MRSIFKPLESSVKQAPKAGFSRPPRLTVQPFQFGIDLGGTKTELIVLDRVGRTQFKQRVPTPASHYQAIVQAIVSLVRQAETSLGVTAQALGVGAPGTPFGLDGRLKNANTTCLIGQPLATDLQNLLAIPVIVENDANCLVLSEATDGAASGANTVFGVILGTGVGGGLVVNKQLVNGPNRITGEWGHNPLPRWFKQKNAMTSRRQCYCGLEDCIETYLSGQGLSLTYKELNRASDETLTAKDIVQTAQSGDEAARVAIEHYFDALSQSLATVINVIDPDIIVFGGGLSQLPSLCASVQARLSGHVFGGDVQTRLAVATHGDSSGVRGAAWLTRPYLGQSLDHPHDQT